MYGLQTFSDSGVVSIDGSYKAFRVLMSGYIPDATTFTVPGIVNQYSYPQPQATPPLLFFRPATLGVYVYGYAGLNSFSCYTYNYLIPPGGSKGVYYVVLAPVVDIPAVGHGVIAYGENGNTIINSSYSLMSVDCANQIYTINYVKYTTDTTLITLTGEQPFGTKKRYVQNNRMGLFYMTGISGGGYDPNLGYECFGDGATVINETTVSFKVTTQSFYGEPGDSPFGPFDRPIVLMGGFL
jgi:hypothetical protein